MKKKYTAKACVCVTRQALVIFSPDFPDLQSMTVTSEVMTDLEVINQPALERVIKNWLRRTQLVPSSLAIFFVEDTYFFEDVTQVPVSVEDPQVLEFAATAPFANVVTKIFPTQNGARIVAINRELLQPIISAFEKVGFSVLAAAPSFAIGITSENPFTKEIAQVAVKTESVFTTYNFIESSMLEKKLVSEKSFFSVHFDKKLIAMIIFFVVLIGILIVLLIFQNG